MAQQYLCYDIKGIQSFIFKIPKLKYIIGGSVLIDRFDKVDVLQLERQGVERLFSGGGKGAFLCDETQLIGLKSQLIEKAHAIGVDIRFGIDAGFSVAAQNADELHAYIPQLNDGFPCPVSGLYPVEDGSEHPVVRKRIFQKGEQLNHYFEKQLLQNIQLPDIDKERLCFFHDISDKTNFGESNRWAVIAMDGNDMGFQFRHQVSMDNPDRLNEAGLQQWIRDMSHAIDDCSNQAAIKGIEAVIAAWQQSDDWQSVLDSVSAEVVLPIRPLVVGGDDIIALCHPDYAMTFVKTAVTAFNEHSKQYAKLWPATHGELTITAGILFAPVTLPLHTAIPYAETLLASAKTRGRELHEVGYPSPPCIDWEHITDATIDTPAAKRQRELIYFDEALDRTIYLTGRPYNFDDFKKVEAITATYRKEVSVSTRHRILPALTSGYAERLEFYAMIKKHHPTLYDELNEFVPSKPGEAWTLTSDGAATTQKTSVIDALMLLEELG